MKCPCCDQELPSIPTLAFSDRWHAIMRDGKCVQLTGLQYKVVAALRRCKLNADELVGVIYAGSRDGGPLTGRNLMHVTIAATNKKIKPMGLQVVADPPRGRAARYELVEAK